MKEKFDILKYKKIIMLALILVSITILITATYITTYNNNIITREDVITTNMSGKIQKDFEKDFLSNFEEFSIYMSSEEEVKYDGDKVYDVSLITEYVNLVNLDCTNEEWFNGVKEFAVNHGYAANPKEYKQNPEAFKGNVSDVSTVIRVAITTKSNTPDLYHIIKLLGKQRILERINEIK